MKRGREGEPHPPQLVEDGVGLALDSGPVMRSPLTNAKAASAGPALGGPLRRHRWGVLANSECSEDLTTRALIGARRHLKSQTRGRWGAPAEVALRLLVLKHVRNWSYATLEREVRSNLVHRAFTRIGVGPVPDAKKMGR
jgi:hypothetical protein